MAGKRKHRGPNPEDAQAFGRPALPRLREAAADFAWLLTRGYAQRSGIKLVGDRYALGERQRLAVLRCTCSDAELASRSAREVPAAQVSGQTLWLDGYNVLTTIEAALGKGVVLAGRDGAWRDMASIHGHFHFVEETSPALTLLGEMLAKLKPSECVWLLDRPVSNSGRLAARIRDAATPHGWPWRVELVQNPDPMLAAAPPDVIAATADSAILDRCSRWLALTREVVCRHVPQAWVVRMFG
jgi:hypothetical protein